MSRSAVSPRSHDNKVAVRLADANMHAKTDREVKIISNGTEDSARPARMPDDPTSTRALGILPLFRLIRCNLLFSKPSGSPKYKLPIMEPVDRPATRTANSG